MSDVRALPPPNIPVPSIYADDRGEIHNHLVGGKRLNLLFTRAGVMRSGDLHRNTQKDFVFSGRVRIWLRDLDAARDEKREFAAGDYLAIPPGRPHIFEFLEDTVVAEWWEPEPFGAYYYEPYRSIVDASFDGSAAPSRGVFTRLVPDAGQ